MLSPTYEIHERSRDGKRTMYLNKSEIEKLIDLLAQKRTIYIDNISYNSIWEAMCGWLINTYGETFNIDYSNIKIPNYMLLPAK